MNKKTKILIPFILFVLNVFSQEINYPNLVNPFIGTGGHGHTFPGAVVPFGMVQLSPDTRIDGSWDGCSGYHYSDSVIYGFSHTHLSGTGVSDWGDILVIPSNQNYGHISNKYANKFKHSNEKAHAGFYSVLLENNINVKLTTTERVGIHQYTFPDEKSFIYLDLLHRDKTINSQLNLIDSFTIEGYRVSEAWAKEQYCYFTLKSNKPIISIDIKNGSAYDLKNIEEKIAINESAIIEYSNNDKSPLILKVAISNVDNKGSSQNLNAEAKHWDFKNYVLEAEKVWQKQLSKIIISESNVDKQQIFYTALYHCFIHPSLDMDMDRRYRGRDNKIHLADNYTHYNVFSLWDTYRALHPLFTMFERKRTSDFINTFHHQYLESNRLPVWELSSNETNCMIGYHSVSVIADAFMKGIKDYDTISIYKAMRASANSDIFGISTFYKKRFLEINDESESVSKSLEYAYDNWCIAQMGIKLGMLSETPQLLKSAQAYKNIFDKNTGFMRPRINGNWYSPFNPNEINNHFTEGNSWHYSFYVPHDISGLIKLHGSDNAFEKKLDDIFSVSSETTGRDQADVTGLVGQYAHGNEPSHHSPFLYHYIGKPQKTFEKVNFLLQQFYSNAPDGLIGNDDCGQMSAWYVLSSLGLYQVCPGNTDFVFFQPQFDKTEMRFENGFVTTILADQSAITPISNYIYNGQFTTKSFISYSDIVNNASIKFNYATKGGNPSTYGTLKNNRPISEIIEFPIVPAPIISYTNKTFDKTNNVIITSINSSDNTIRYTQNGQIATKNSTKFNSVITLKVSTQINAKAFSKNDSSINITANLFKLNSQFKVHSLSKSNKQYSADGFQSLVDNVYGDTDWRKGDWLGFQGQDFECIIENRSAKTFSSIGANFLQETRSWIIFPTEVEYYSSMDGIKYKLIGSVKSTIHANNYNPQTKAYDLKVNKSEKMKYIKVVAKNYGILPEWHEGKGNDAFIFIDEIELK